MLSYHPIHDPSHCIFRLLCLSHDLRDEKIPVDLIRILDFYLLFPHVLASLSLPRDMLDVKKVFKVIQAPYESLPTPSRLMFELSSIQDQAIKSLMAKGIVEQSELYAGYVSVRKEIVPTEITNIFEEISFRKSAWYQVLINNIAKMSLKGSGGLKDRSGLLEYRYDNA